MLEGGSTGGLLLNPIDGIARLPPARNPAPPWSRRAREATAAAHGGSNVSHPAVAPVVVDPNAPRDVYLGSDCFENARAHWFLFVPSQTHPSIGKVIQVTGNPWVGFGFQVKLNYCSQSQALAGVHSETPGQPQYRITQMVRLGSTAPSNVVDDYVPSPLSGPQLRDFPVDKLEGAAYDLGLPYRDPNAVLPDPSDPVWRGKVPHPQIERCQGWVKRVVERWVELDLLDGEAIEALKNGRSFGI
ncbi:hypothetical protein BKA93DRAFT_466922 [Sparassis latifolia]